MEKNDIGGLPNMRTLRFMMVGDDVLQLKNRLVELGYLQKATHNLFGLDTLSAVKSFQAGNGLAVDGVVGEFTWSALFDEEPAEAPNIPPHIGADKAAKISASLATVSKTRREIVLEALKWAIDPNSPVDPKCFYVRGGNLYNTDLSPNIMTKTKLQKYFAKTAYQPYFKNAKPMMEAFAEKSGYKIGGADCSGFVVGLWRNAKVVSTGFDANANSLYSSFCTKTTKPIPGDLAWRSGHIGLVVCNNPLMVAESVGGDYTTQITFASNRKAYNFVDKKLHSFGGWSSFGDPKKY